MIVEIAPLSPPDLAACRHRRALLLTTDYRCGCESLIFTDADRRVTGHFCHVHCPYVDTNDGRVTTPRWDSVPAAEPMPPRRPRVEMCKFVGPSIRMPDGSAKTILCDYG